MAVRIAFDDVRRGFACAEGVHELAFDAGDGAVEDGLGFGAEGFQGIVAQGLVIEAGFLLVDVA